MTHARVRNRIPANQEMETEIRRLVFGRGGGWQNGRGYVDGSRGGTWKREEQRGWRQVMHSSRSSTTIEYRITKIKK